ncbi:RimJ/RimL family protein N-acetyltransferase [Gramella sp. Hel_I_59]|uniref:GNAT family N-acetyltransferase n=1 Tax=Gramella sp. Hel_I_59 TaxID=1249978 RepID=UPI00114F4F9A|nr:GNAT family N-acetyltransferase [Gramella sp. Hel_I_59]TQI69521.1 RimJ/RimL family protein N-acetyltransferase [Gramella sp. Hel_I_59]
MGEFRSFETERLLLRPMSLDDAAFIFRLYNSPKWLQFIGDRNLRNTEDARVYIKDRMLPQLNELGFSNYCVVRKVDNVKIGACGLYDREGLQEIDLGFAFLPEYEGKGYASEATNTLVKAAKNIFSLKALQAITRLDNTGSQRLLEKLGFEHAENIKIPKDPAELMLYQIQL